MRQKKVSLIVFLVCWGLTLCWPAFAEDGEDKPERSITMAVEYPGIEIPPDEDVSMDIIFYNKGRSDENVDVHIAEKPEGWKARIKTYSFTVTGIHVPPGDDKTTLSFEAEPEKTVKPGKYEFRIEAQTRDGQFRMAETIFVTLKEKDEGEKEDRGVKLTTSYPVLRGPSDGEFEFSVEVDSKLDKDAIFDLFAQGPQGWDVNFKPAYESKYISSLRIKANQSQTVAVQVKPPAMTKEGEYPVNVRVNSGDAKGEATLTVILTGTYDIEVGTATGLLSLDARQGKPANFSFYIRNTGSAGNSEIKFMSFKPENWKLKFEPEKIDSLEPGGLKQVDVTLTPYEEALVGDYSVNIKVDGEKASETLEFRVTVKASAAWAWIGILIIVAVVIGLTALFRKLGRR
ncbi:NEW3 domain-containing protein [Desulfococcaceae bacterium HSG8]|nr:NEW3 domain-containing protein [Desulfococcaceae bacterium HSG8]